MLKFITIYIHFSDKNKKLKSQNDCIYLYSLLFSELGQLSSEHLDSELLEVSSNSVQALKEFQESTSTSNKQPVCSLPSHPITVNFCCSSSFFRARRSLVWKKKKNFLNCRLCNQSFKSRNQQNQHLTGLFSQVKFFATLRQGNQEQR